jgi:aminomethyltransferase
VQYTGVLDEHLACRSAAGLFDVSHMGEVHAEGRDAEAFLNYLVTNNVAKLAVGQAQYTAMCHAHGGIVDDLVIYRRAADRFLVVVNASNTAKDFQHVRVMLSQFAAGGSPQVALSDESARYSQIALQGRLAEKILQKLTESRLADVKFYHFTEGHVLGDIPAVLARTGYTGEDGFEIYVPWEQGPRVWNALLEIGQPLGLKPCGLGARDTLRLEMKYPLYGNELTDDTLPVEAGLAWVVKLAKERFVGRAAIVKAKEAGLKQALIGFKLLERGIARHGYPVLDRVSGEKIGHVTSGSQSPCLGQAIGIAYVPIDQSKIGSVLHVDIRGTRVPAEVIPTPFYKRPY